MSQTSDQRHRAGRDTARGEVFAQSLNGAADTFPRGFLGRSKRHSDLTETSSLEICQDHAASVARRELGHRAVEQRQKFLALVGVVDLFDVVDHRNDLALRGSQLALIAASL